MTSSLKSASPPTRNFWERHPYGGFLAFVAVMAAVGSFLAYRIGERPHHRRDEWRVFTDVPPPGSGLEGGPSMGEMVATMAGPVVHNWIVVQVEDSAGRALGHREVALVRGDEDELLATGITEPVGGRVRIPVPPPAEPDYYRGAVRAVLLSPHEQSRVLDVPPPTKGMSSITFLGTQGAGLGVSVRGLSVGIPADRNARVRVARTNGSFDPRSIGCRVVNGAARLGGLPAGKRVKVALEVPGRETVIRVVEISSGIATTAVFDAGERHARLRIRPLLDEDTPLPDGERLKLTATGTRNHDLITHTADVAIKDGVALCEIPSGLDVAVELMSVERSGRSVTLRLPVVQPDSDLTAPAALLKEQLLLEGEVRDDQGLPVANVAVIAHGRRDGHPVAIRALTDAAGRYRILGAPLDEPGVVTAMSEGLAGYHRVDAAASGATVTLATAGGLSGTTITENSILQGTVLVEVWRDGIKLTSRRPAWRRDRGEFVLKDLAPGDYELRVGAALQSERRLPVTIAAGRITELEALTLDAVKASEVRVRSTAGSTENAQVTVHAEGLVPVTLSTGPFGRVILPLQRTAPSMRIDVEADDGYESATAQSFPLDITLKPWCHATLLAPERNDEPRDRWLLIALRGPSGIQTPWQVMGANQRVRFSRLREGRYTVVAKTIAKAHSHDETAARELEVVAITPQFETLRLNGEALSALIR